MRLPHRIQKRYFVVTALAILAVLVLVGSFLWYITGFSDKGSVSRLVVKTAAQRTPVLGAGISLDRIQASNLLQDSSFEPVVYRQALVVYSGDETNLTVSAQEAGQGQYPDGFFTGASARVLTHTESGLALKKAAKVSNFGLNRVGVFQPVVLPGDVKPDAAFLDFASHGDITVGVGEKGLVVRNLAGQATETVNVATKADLTGIYAGPGYLAACSLDGELLFSKDGREWDIITANVKKRLRAITVSDTGTVVAIGDSGSIVVGDSKSLTALRPVTRADLTDLAYGQGFFLAVGQRGTILTSKNGLIWRSSGFSAQADWLALDYRDGVFCLVGENGQIAVSEDGINFSLQQGLDADLVDVVMLSRHQIICLAADGQFFITNDAGQNWQKSGIDTGMHSKVISQAGKDKIISAGDKGQLGLAQTVAEISLESSLAEGQYQAGDLVFLEKTSPELPGAPQDGGSPFWELYGEGSWERSSDILAPGGGLGSLHLRAEGSGEPVILSQVLDKNQTSAFRGNEILQLSFWMRQQEIKNRSVDVWLSGPFQSVGTSFTNVSTGWQKYTHVFVLPARPGGYADQELRFNLALDSGQVWLDQVFFGRHGESPELLARALHDETGLIRPQVIRLDFIGIGGQASLAENWAWPLHNSLKPESDWSLASQYNASLHAGLELARSSGADPWLVLDSYTTENEILNLLEYLAAPISEQYGKIRQERGMVLPWTGHFQRVYLEICDRNEIFQTDREKAEYVNMQIRTLISSPYYRQVKGQLVFVDAMSYQDGVMLSRADFHASDLAGIVQSDRTSTAALALDSFLDQVPRNPDKPATDFAELIRQASLPGTALTPLHLADLLDLALYDLGGQSGLVNLDLARPEERQIIISAASIISQVVKGNVLSISQITADEDKTGLTGAIRAYGFSDSGELDLVLLNLSEQAATCQLLSEIALRGAKLAKYDDAGNLLGRQTLSRNSGNITILPGGAVVLQKADAKAAP